MLRSLALVRQADVPQFQALGPNPAVNADPYRHGFA